MSLITLSRLLDLPELLITIKTTMTNKIIQGDALAIARQLLENIFFLIPITR
jgi:hypothetical protein